MTNRVCAPLLLFAYLCLPLCGCNGDQPQSTPPPTPATNDTEPTVDIPATDGQPTAPDNNTHMDPIEDEDVHEIE